MEKIKWLKKLMKENFWFLNLRNSQIFKLIPCDLTFKDPWKEKKVCNDNNYLYEVKMKEKL